MSRLALVTFAAMACMVAGPACSEKTLPAPPPLASPPADSDATDASVAVPRKLVLPAAFSAAPRIDGPLRGLVEAAGADAFAIVAVRPEAWAALRDRLKPWIASLGLPVLAKDALLGSADPLTAVTDFFEEPPPAGWDRSRPMLFAGGAVDDADPILLRARALLVPGPREGFSGLRHRVIIPATDPAGLVASLSGMALTHFQKEAPELAAQAGSRAYVADGGFFALIPGEGLVRIELLTHDTRTYVDDAARVKAYRPLLAESSAGPVTVTPALVHLMTEDAAAGLYVRGWRLRSIALWVALTELRAALAGAKRDAREKLSAYAGALLGGLQLVLGAGGAEVDDVAVSLSGRDGIRLRVVASLTELGQAAVAAGARGATNPASPTGGLLQAGVSFSLDAAIDAARVPPALAAFGDDIDAAAHALGECGYLCGVELGLRHPLGSLKLALDGLVRRHLGVDVARELPRAVSLTVLPADPRVPRRLPTALSFELADAQDTTRLEQALALAQLASRIEPQLERWPRPDGLTVGVGFWTPPAEAFDLTAPGVLPGGSLAFVKARMGALASHLGLAGKRAELLRPWASLQARLSHVGAAVVVDVMLPAGLALADLPRLPDHRGASWQVPGESQGVSKGHRCLSNATRHLMRARRATARGDTGAAGEALAAAVAQVDCARDDPETGGAALVVAGTLALDRVRQAAAGLRLEEAAALAKSACDGGTKLACGRAAALAKLPKAMLPEAPECSEPSAGDVTMLHVGGAGVWMGEQLQADASALAAALSGPASDGRFRVVADRQLTWRQVAPAIRAIPDLMGRHARLVTREAREGREAGEPGRLRDVLARLPEAPIGEPAAPKRLLVLAAGELRAERPGRPRVALTAGAVDALLKDIGATRGEPATLLVTPETAWADVVATMGASCGRMLLGRPPGLSDAPESDKIGAPR